MLMKRGSCRLGSKSYIRNNPSPVQDSSMQLRINWKLVSILLAIALVVLASYEVFSIIAPSQSNANVSNFIGGPCTFVLYQNSGAFLADNCATGKNDYREQSSDTLFSDMQTVLASTGGQLYIRKGTWILASQWPTVDLSALAILRGEGPQTRFVASGAANFDPLNATRISLFDLDMVDRYGVEVSFTCDSTCQASQQQAFPLDVASARAVGTTYVDFLGNYIRLDSQKAAFPALETGYAVVFRNQSGVHSFRLRAIVRVAQTMPFYPLFMEPVKGDYNDFTGFRWTSTTNLMCRTSTGGSSIQNNATETMDTKDHTYEIRYQSNQVTFLYDGATICTNTNFIMQYPGPSSNKAPIGPVLETCEPDRVIMAIYLKTPFLIPVTA